MSDGPRRILYVGTSPEAVRAAADRIGAVISHCEHPEDAIAAVRDGGYALVLLHVPDAILWLPALRSNAAEPRYVLLAYPQQLTHEETHPWHVERGALVAPLEAWMSDGPPARAPGALAPDVRRIPGVSGRHWILMSLDDRGELTAAHGWTSYTGQPLEHALGKGWHGMLSEPERWRAAVRAGRTGQAQMGVFNQANQRHHACMMRWVRTKGWTVHIEDHERETERAHRLSLAEKEVGVLRDAGAHARVVLDELIRELEADGLSTLRNVGVDGLDAAAASALADRIEQRLRAAREALVTPPAE